MADYQRMFAATGTSDGDYPVAAADRTPDDAYVFTEQIELAVNVALATARPLLVLGPPGSGKTSLARAVKDKLGWDYYEHVVTSRSKAQDVQWRFDAVRRLAWAQQGDTGTALDDRDFVEPGGLWWCLDPTSAAAVRNGGPAPVAALDPAPGAVLLLDEIDKADPGVPNDLLRPLGDLRFTVPELDHLLVELTRDRPPLVIITTNRERSLPPAFVRRCVVIELPGFSAERLQQIATAHFGKADADLHAAVIEELERHAVRDRAGEPILSAAEYLDAIRACHELAIGAQHPLLTGMLRNAAIKDPARA
jgi:MoxR-like ATPase